MDHHSGHSESSDDDSISVTSTIQSEPQEVYPLDSILAERVEDGATQYLVKWEGYPLERCTWEAEDNFQNDATLPEWKLTRERIKAGLEKPFDVESLEQLIEDNVVATERRKARREEKRRRLGFLYNSESSSYQGTAKPDYARSSSRQSGLALKTTAYQGTANQSDHIVSEGERDARKKRKISQPEKLRVPQPQQYRKVGARGRGPAKMESRNSLSSRKVNGAAIFDNWQATPRRRKVPLHTPSKDDKATFKTLAIQRRVELSGRNEPAPNLENLTFVNLKDGKSVMSRANSLPIKPTNTRTPFQMIQESLTARDTNPEDDSSASPFVDESLFVEEPGLQADDQYSAPPKAWEAAEKSNLSSHNKPGSPDVEKDSRTTTSSAETTTEAAENSRLSTFNKPRSTIVESSHKSTIRWDRITTEAASPASDRQPHDSRVGRSRRASFPTVSRTHESQADAMAQLPTSLNRSGLVLLSFSGLQGQGNCGMRPNDPTRFPEQKVRKEDMSDVYGSLIVEHETLNSQSPMISTEGTIAISGTMFRGLLLPVSRLLLTIKKPPRDVHITIHSLWSSEQYRARFHDEVSKCRVQNFYFCRLNLVCSLRSSIMVQGT